MRETVLKGDIYNGSDFSARSERGGEKEGGSFAVRNTPRAVVEERRWKGEDRGKTQRGEKKRKKEGTSRTFESGIRSEPEETRRNAIIAAKDNLTGGSFPPRLLLAVRPRLLFFPLSFLFLIHLLPSSSSSMLRHATTTANRTERTERREHYKRK